MLDYIIGNIVEILEDSVIIETSGFGIKVHTPHKFSKGKEKIYTHLVIKEENIKLFGFKDRKSRDLFLKLIDVKGVGVKHAFSILKNLSIEEIFNIIENQDINSLSKIQGIGKKTASRIILELKGKLNFNENELINEAVDALISLGFEKDKVIKIVSQISKNTKDIESIIKLSLQKLSEKG
ncbi:Holliday junction branch migration protein RuvA [Hydrogenothermus marinus]|uniref:Holliday junction branch migration complex subunit RuvA n=1 Tax=Hydrogenothermus marinus TaxID=133270 RepID=A0A3M0B703_9AQUI|nr:Holliday junction branch migration protein RuvA [Hydrogenothermus marinus]RMA93143.1 Holliday junction DNA helicase subunit RuvA [Hydrogenothermus marinus]